MIFKMVMVITFAMAAIASRHDTEFLFLGASPEIEFKSDYGRSLKRIQSFYEKNNFKIQATIPNLLKTVEIYSTKAAFDKKLIQLSSGQISAIPKTYVAVVDKKVLRIISWDEYKKIHSEDSKVDYEKLISHEMAHQLHVELVRGNENLMGPTWFFEGFAVIAADQYPDFQLPDQKQIQEVIQNPNRGDYKTYGAILRGLIKKKTLSELIEMAQHPDFNAKVIEILK